MGKINLAVNQLLERKEIFADLINGALFNGEQLLQPDKMEQVSSHSGVFRPGKRRKISSLERYGDVRMEAELGTYSVIFSNETQGEVHYAMPVRNMLYDALEYMKQVQMLEKKHKDNDEKLEGGEFLSRIRKEDRIKPVITTVLYCGEEWDGSKSLRDMLNITENDFEKIRKYLPDYRINIVNVGNVVYTEKFRTSLKYIFGMLRFRKDKERLYEYINANREAIEKMDYVETVAAFVLLGEQKRIEEWLGSEEDKEDVTMCQAIDELINDGKQNGENRMLDLVSFLIRDGKMQFIERIRNDAVLREELCVQYGI